MARGDKRGKWRLGTGEERCVLIEKLVSKPKGVVPVKDPNCSAIGPKLASGVRTRGTVGDLDGGPDSGTKAKDGILPLCTHCYPWRFQKAT